MESVLARPQASVLGANAYPGVHEKAAALMASMATNHALADGNKRTAWPEAQLFYGLNDYRIPATADQCFDLIVAVVTRESGRVAETAPRLKRIAVLAAHSHRGSANLSNTASRG